MSRAGEKWYLVERANHSPPMSPNAFGHGPCPMDAYMDHDRAAASVGPGDHMYEVTLVKSWRGVTATLIEDK